MGFWSGFGAASLETQARAKENRGKSALFERWMSIQFQRINQLEEEERIRKLSRNRSHTYTSRPNPTPIAESSPKTGSAGFRDWVDSVEHVHRNTDKDRNGLGRVLVKYLIVWPVKGVFIALLFVGLFSFLASAMLIITNSI